MDRAVSLCLAHPSAVARMTLAGLLVADRPEHEVSAALQQVAQLERPRLERRTACFTSLANVSVWTGLFGTITGLVTSYACVGSHGDGSPTIDPARKAELIAGQLAEAMHCAAGGLLVAVVALVCLALVNGRTQRLLDELDEAAGCIAHAIEIRRSDVSLLHPFRTASSEHR